MAEDLSYDTAAKSSSDRAYHLESFWKCCQCKRNGGVGIFIPLGNSICRNGHQRCDGCVVGQVKISGNPNASEYEDSRSADGADEDNEYLLRYNPIARGSRPRAASCDSSFKDGQRRQPRPSLSPWVSWDDSALDDKYHVALGLEEDKLQKGRNMGIAARRTANINVFDDSANDISTCSSVSSLAESGLEDGLLEDRFLHPVQYFQELDDLGSKIYKRSMFRFYIDGEAYSPFNGKLRFTVPFFENASFQNNTFSKVLRFCEEVVNLANEYAPSPGATLHYGNHQMYHREIENLSHLIECRNVISGVWENIKTMKAAHYCGDFISSLVLDHARPRVAKLVRVECSSIEQLAIAFETCLHKTMSYDPSMVLFDIITTFSIDVSIACREVLTKFGMSIPDLDLKDVWRCVVHVLDFVVLSYAGAHTQYLGDETITSVDLPGSFLEKQYFRFRRRKFSCLNEFLGGQGAWVLELYHASTLHGDLTPLGLLTDAVTFGDIWGPMWKSCVLDHEDRIIHYNVGNGVIFPWNRATSTSKDAIEVQKGEVFCHWMSDKEVRDQKGLASSSTLHENDTILIGASVRLHTNDTCRASTAGHIERLRNSGSLSEIGTIKSSRALDSETVQIQVTPPHIGFAYQRQYKIRGRSMKDCLIEEWKNSPLSRQVKSLEFKLGLEVSTCTYNARRIRLIELFGTNSMLNYLRSISLQWTSIECQESFYSALQSADHTAFRELYKSQPGWRTDVGNAIGCCFDKLIDTGKRENDLVLFWAPDAEPGQKVTLKADELSWIGFLEDTETSGTLAVLEDKCLELLDLDIGRKCLSNRFNPRHTDNRPSTGTFHGPILETSVHLNKFCVPASIRSMKNYDTPSEYLYRWSLLSLEEGDKFEFGKKGNLKAITLLPQGRILAKWSSSLDIMHQLQTASSKIPVLGRSIDTMPPKIHYECIRDGKEDTSPVSFMILSTARTVLQSARVSRRSSFQTTSLSWDHWTWPYHFNSSDFGTPRTIDKPSKTVPTVVKNEWKNVLDRLRQVETGNHLNIRGGVNSD